MDVIQLGLYLIYEFVVLSPAWVALAGGVLVFSWILGGRVKPINKCRVRKRAALFAMMMGGVAFFALPWWVNSSVRQINYFMDWLFQMASVLGGHGVCVFSRFTAVFLVEVLKFVLSIR